MTYWALITFNLYLLVAAISVSTTFITVQCKPSSDEENVPLVRATPPQSCGCSENKVSWYQMVQWLLFIIGNEMAFIVVIYYWLFLYEGGPIDAASINRHLLNGIVALIDLWVSGVPMKFIHFIYSVLYGAVYVAFTVVYYKCTGRIIYSTLDYENHFWKALGLVLSAVFVAVPAIHVFIFYLQYKVKQDILQYIRKCDIL